MNVVVLILVIISALFAIAAGVWVAFALVRAVSTRRTAAEPESKSQTSGQDSGVSG
jgi:hypothetical protein